MLPFKSALLGAAEAVLADGQHVTVQPVSTAYTGAHGMPMGRENRPLFAWYGDMELVPHLWEALKAGPAGCGGAVSSAPQPGRDGPQGTLAQRAAGNRARRARPRPWPGRGMNA